MEKKTQNVNNHPRIDWKNFKEAYRQLKETFRHTAHSIEKHGVARHRKAVNIARITRLIGVYMVITQ